MSQSKGKGKARAVPRVVHLLDEENGEGSGSEYAFASNRSKITPEQANVLIGDLMRLMLFNEAKKRSMPRKDFDLVMKDYKDPKLSKYVLTEAGKRFDSIFGLQMMELLPNQVSKRQRTGHCSTIAENLNLSRAAVHGNVSEPEKPGKIKFSSRYVLLNALSADELSALPAGSRLGSSSAADATEFENVGLLMVVLALMYLSNNSITDKDLYHFLEKLDLKKGTPAHLVPGGKGLEATIESFVTQLYLEKRVDGHGDDKLITYTKGPRSFANIDDLTVAHFVAKIYGDPLDPLRAKQLGATDNDGDGGEAQAPAGEGGSGDQQQQQQQQQQEGGPSEEVDTRSARRGKKRVKPEPRR